MTVCVDIVIVIVVVIVAMITSLNGKVCRGPLCSRARHCVIVIAVGMTPIGIWRLRRMDLVEKVKDLSQ